MLTVKPGRNQPCPCGSGRKYKRCHGSVAPAAPSREPPTAPASTSFASAADRRAAQEFIRQRQQGLGRPIIAAKLGDRQFVSVGKTLYQSARWKTFPDFLDDYIRRVFDPGWGNDEIASFWRAPPNSSMVRYLLPVPAYLHSYFRRSSQRPHYRDNLLLSWTRLQPLFAGSQCRAADAACAPAKERREFPGRILRADDR